jgi:hypothetical protein
MGHQRTKFCRLGYLELGICILLINDISHYVLANSGVAPQMEDERLFPNVSQRVIHQSRTIQSCVLRDADQCHHKTEHLRASQMLVYTIQFMGILYCSLNRNLHKHRCNVRIHPYSVEPMTPVLQHW